MRATSAGGAGARGVAPACARQRFAAGQRGMKPGRLGIDDSAAFEQLAVSGPHRPHAGSGYLELDLRGTLPRGDHDTWQRHRPGWRIQLELHAEVLRRGGAPVVGRPQDDVQRDPGAHVDGVSRRDDLELDRQPVLGGRRGPLRAHERCRDGCKDENAVTRIVALCLHKHCWPPWARRRPTAAADESAGLKIPDLPQSPLNTQRAIVSYHGEDWYSLQ